MIWSAILSAVTSLVGLIRDFFSWMAREDAKQAGRNEAVIEGRNEEDAALKRTKDAIDEADTKPIEYRD